MADLNDRGVGGEERCGTRLKIVGLWDRCGGLDGVSRCDDKLWLYDV